MDDHLGARPSLGQHILYIIGYYGYYYCLYNYVLLLAQRMLLQIYHVLTPSEAYAAAARASVPIRRPALRSVVLGGLIAHPADKHLSVREVRNTPTVEEDLSNRVNWEVQNCHYNEQLRSVTVETLCLHY